MTWEVQRVTEEDIPRVFEVVSLAFDHDHEYFDGIFPGHETPEGRKVGSERFLQMFQLDPTGNWIKVVDTADNNKIIGAAKWNFYNGSVPPQPAVGGDYWKNEEDKEFAQSLFHGFFSLRQRLIEETNGQLVALEMMMVDPAYQRKGVGRLLVKWGLEEADRQGVQASVEGSDKGRGLYASEGFEVQGDRYIVPVPEKFDSRRKQTYFWMKRPAQNKA